MATIKDVAKKSGFSVCTVSRALSGKGYLKEETRQKIMDAVKELDYRPNTLAVNLKTGRRQTLALILPSLTNIYYAKLEQYMESYASRKGYLLYLSNTEYSVIDIAVACGFDDQSYFSKVFKKYTGMTPKQYR